VTTEAHASAPDDGDPEHDRMIAYEGAELTIGASNANTVVLDHEAVARYHATIVASGGELELRDLGSPGGTRLDGRAVSRAVIDDGAMIEVGPYRLRFDGSRFEASGRSVALRLDATDVAVRRDGKRILEPVSLSVVPGELVAIIGESGSGKTTLLRSLAGVDRPSEGTVNLSGRPVRSRQTEVGYVPQDEIVHPLLRVEEALRYSARLRLGGADGREVRSTVDRVLAELALEPHRGTRIDRLSGGQRKRVGVGAELLTRPSLLFLDEPTTGLDPVLELQLMELFRSLARPAARAVVLVTHATRNLALCDRVVVLRRGGSLAFSGLPAEALRFFGVDSYDDIYAALDRRPAAEPDVYREAHPATAADADDASAGTARRPDGLTQLGVLLSRYLRVFARDRRNALILFGQVPLIAFGIAFLFEGGLFDPAGSGPDGMPMPGRPRDAIQALFLLVTTAIWFGSISASREIVKERAVAEREAAVGVRWGAYLTSKALLLFAVAAVQTLALAYFVFVVHPLEEPPGGYLAITALLVLSSWAAVGVGLSVSAACSTQDQATSFIPLTLIPQLLFAGAIVPVDRMGGAIEALSHAIFARWALAGSGAELDMQDRIEADRAFDRAGGYGDVFFSIEPTQALGILIAFLVGFLALARGLVSARRS
jgi:ABC-type multidrug transport system ATPase subunit